MRIENNGQYVKKVKNYLNILRIIISNWTTPNPGNIQFVDIFIMIYPREVEVHIEPSAFNEKLF